MNALSKFYQKDRHIARLLIMTVIWLAFMAITRFDKFYTIANFQTIAGKFPEFGVMALGAMLCMITGGIDLSSVGVANLTSILMALYMRSRAGDSGTVSAAREARMCGLPAMAVSIMTGADWNTLLRLGRLAVDIAEKTDGKELPRLSILNLNAPAIPADQWKPLRLAPLSDACYLDSYERRVSPRGQSYFWLEAGLKIEPHRPGTDMALLNDGCPVLSLVGPYLEENGWIRENLQELIH